MKKHVLTFLSVCFAFSGYAAQVDTVAVHSPSMKKDIKAVVILPDSYNTEDHFPVLYLLHGYSGSYRNWVSRAPGIQEKADLFDMIIVCPDGGYGSWYWDSPEDTSYRYERFVAKELVDWVDENYRTVKDPEGRAITGLSMGGHGALYLAFRHQDTFGAAGSMSGGVDIRPFPENWEISDRLGSYAENKEQWEQHTVINMLHLLTPGSLEIIIDCGTSDFFYDVNLNLHHKLQLRNIPHTFISRPGVHNWDYWEDAVLYQMLFMHQFFTHTAQSVE